MEATLLEAAVQERRRGVMRKAKQEGNWACGVAGLFKGTVNVIYSVYSETMVKCQLFLTHW